MVKLAYKEKARVKKLEMREAVLETIMGLAIPLLGTVLGSGMVFVLKKEIKPEVEKLLLGFAAGIMTAASVWSLLIPAMEQATALGQRAWVPALVGFLLGIGFLLVLDMVIPHLHIQSDQPEGVKSRLSRSAMLVFAVTLHNIPEGMAVGVIFASVLSGETHISMASAFVLAIGIAIQNFPEGAVISLPLLGSGTSKRKAFGYGALSGAVEPISAALTILITSFIVPILPYILSFAAGAMIYVVFEELVPDSHKGEHSNMGTIGVAAGFALMMVLDVALG